MKIFGKYSFPLSLIIVLFSFSACTKDEEVRMPDDILGVWQTDATHFLQFNDDNIVKPFFIERQDGESIGKWGWDDVYFYEPGYNLVIYLSSEHQADVYQIITLTSNRMTWCPVDKIDASDAHDIGSIIGQIINKAQEGYSPDPALYESFTKISENEFLDILDSLDLILNPWEWE